jgi:hypothetical protein
MLIISFIKTTKIVFQKIIHFSKVRQGVILDVTVMGDIQELKNIVEHNIQYKFGILVNWNQKIGDNCSRKTFPQVQA